MRLETVGEVIAERTLVLQIDVPARLIVRMGKPQPFSSSTDYYCPYQISVLDFDRIWYAGGVDAFQSVELCLRMIGIELAAISREYGKPIRWEGDDEGGWGFPFLDEFRNT